MEVTKQELLRVKDVAKKLNLCGRMIYKLSAMGAMPAPIKLGRSTRWRADEIESWINGGCRPIEQGGRR